MSVKFLGGSPPPKYLTVVCPSNISGVYTPEMFDGCVSVKYLTHPHASVTLGAVDPRNALTDVCPSNIWGVYTPKIFDGCMSVKYLGGLHPGNI